MKFHICAVLLCLVQDGQALRDANEKNGKSSLPDVNETKEASCGTQCSIKKKTQLPSDVQHEVDEENNYAHQPRKRDIPNWSEKYDKDPHGHLHMGSALGMFMIALLLQWTTQPQQRKDAVASAMRKARKPRFLNQAAARADVDAEGSDSEDEATSSSDSHGTPCVMKLGPGMRFLDEDLEEEWEKESYPKNQQRGAVLLALVAFGLAVDRFYAFYELQSCKGDQWWMQKSLQIGCILVMVKVFAFLLMVPAVEGAKNGEAASFFLPSKFWDSTYWIILGFFGCFFIVVNLWPISPSCDILSVMARVCSYKSVWIANEKLDCTLQGHTACQMIQLWMLIMPYALPQFRCFHLTFLWLGFFYVGVSWLYAEISGEKTHMVDLGLHFSMLVVTAILGTMKKYYLEKGMRRQFLEDNLQRKALEHLYVVFDGMVPKYVIPRMLMQKPICDYRPRVSILFVLIHDFHVSDANAALTFLNTYFGKMDDICAAHKVTKIETVAEEYVCSVGVVPEDLPVGDTSSSAERQHQELLERLFGAAYEIQQLQNEAQKKFKMGIHTGEIHAGVIGQKLPRFRLFGDTINTSARMMQKASPGQLLFGEATNRLLPSSLKVKEADGIIVKMKGKGDVKAFYYDETNFPKSSAPAKEPSPDKPKEMVVKAEVNKAIRLSDGERPQSLPFLLSEKVDFKSHDPVKEPKFSEEKFQMWFHLGFARKFRLRLHRQILLMAFMTVMDVMHMEHTEAWKVEDKDPGLLPKHPTKRFVILLSCRAVILAMGLGWSVFARTEAFRERVQEVQWGLVASTLIVATVMFVSYDALIYPQLHRSYVTMHFLDYVNQQQSLIFVLAYFIVTNTHPTLFYQSLVYIPLGVVFMYIRNRTSLYISDIGRVMFLCTVVISCLLAHVLEQTSRARFKTKQRVEETQDRVETVLSNLMPKKVLEEIKLSPGLQRSHSYDHATIAQSDLCGFTQLASDKSPEQVVAFVEDLFGRFDRLTDEFQIYKVETVGDAYIAGMAEHTLTSENSPIQVVQFGMAMIQATAEWAEKLGVKVTCRVGVHHGHCVGGVVGKGMQRYHLFGSFMSELDTLEATSREGITQISRACKDAIVREHLQRLGDAAREATLTDVAALEKLQKEFDGAIERSDDKLTTSKGEEHDYSEVGGRTFLIYKFERGVVFVDQNGTPRGSAGTKTMGGGGSKVLDAHRKNLCKQAISGSETWKDKETKMLETFKAWDTDNSGSITKDELQEVFTRLGCKVSSSELQKVLKDADADKDSKISYEEFVAWLCRAPHLEHYFKLSEDILKRNMKDAMAMQQKMQKEIEKSDNPMAAMMKIGVKLEAVQKKGQERIDKELKPVIQKTFQYHDKDGNGVLSYDESIIFFSNYAERLGPFAKSMAELATTQAMNACEIKVDMSSIQKEFDKEFDKCLSGYTSDIDKRHKAAWDALDVNKDGKLQEAEIIEALLHGHPKNQQFMKALGLLVEDKSMTAAGPSAKVEMPMEDCQVQ